MQRAFLGFTTRSLLVCVVLGAFTAAFVHLSRVLGVLFWSVAPWLGAPAPVIPWFLGILMAALLVPRFGAALITSIIGTIVGVGTMALMAGIVIELVFLLARFLQRRSTRGGIDPVGARSGLWWGLLAGALTGVMTYAMMFLVPEFRILSADLMLLALGVRIATGAFWGWLAYLLVRGLLRAGFRSESRLNDGALNDGTTTPVLSEGSVVRGEGGAN